MSKSRYYPSGLADSSGELGKNYIPHFTGNINGFARELIGLKAMNEEGALDRSVVNPFCQSHDIPNLFVVDGSVFPSASEKNPTLTIMALAARTAEYMAERFRRAEL